MKTLSRREFVRISAMGAGAAVLSVGISGCLPQDDDGLTISFKHGVASGDPLAHSVILWARVTPQKSANSVSISWEVATDSNFINLVTNGSTTTSADKDYTVKIDAAGLSSGTTYYYRFRSNGVYSATGRTQTLAEGAVDQVKLAVISCSNYPAGYFHVLNEIARRDDLNAVLHLGDYIYEYARDGYASSDAAAMGREVLPETELFELSDYRTRYALYRTDADMQSFHASLPIISVWDDHEIANDTWREGAENHNDGEGDFSERKAAAIQAYFEWLPIRPFTEGDNETIYRSFHFGDLVDLHMLDTRLIGRDEQLDYADYMDSEGNFDSDTFTADLTDATRTMMGTDQLAWLQGELAADSGAWQVLGNQTLMGKMLLPSSIALQQVSVADYATLAYLYQLYAISQAGGTLTDDQQAYLTANADQLTDANYALVTADNIPYNLDAWDGYYYEREVLFGTVRAYGRNLVVVSGDTHNSWANNLSDASGNAVGVEFAGTSVSSPGMEYYLGTTADDEAGIVSIVDGLQYANLTDRGYLVVTFTASQAQAEWQYVSSVKTESYTMQEDRYHSLTVSHGNNTIG
ncbi:alkaline phosphatase D family protein [Reinekea marinisedimentorum]|uniref:Alkaline phosphatase D n=1 Tax=Reinekea marinisedimentorum TaxID=230495 RepID=A0A4R3IA59_9GAMM|nr:alkaline phosphatase D family protein [Reinekea marinisedimentorum]TCS43170.1 alkaline phosphatase D [Reinekea marinisedimentorum]